MVGVYELPENIHAGTKQAQSYLAGSRWFRVEEIEVYKLL